MSEQLDPLEAMVANRDDYAEAIRTAVAIVQIALQADPWDMPASTDLIDRVVCSTWGDDPIAYVRATAALAVLALALADVATEQRTLTEAGPAEVSDTLAHVVRMLDHHRGRG